MKEGKDAIAILLEYHSLMKHGPKGLRAIRELHLNKARIVILWFRHTEDKIEKVNEKLSKLLPSFSKNQIIQVGLKAAKTSQALASALKQEGLDPDESILVCSDVHIRRAANEIGLQTVADAILLEDHSREVPSIFVNIRIPEQDLHKFRRIAPSFFIPFYMSRSPLSRKCDSYVFLGIVSRKSLLSLAKYRWEFNTLPVDVSTDELYLLFDDASISKTLSKELQKMKQDAFKQMRVIARPISGTNQLLVALKKNQSIDDINLPSGHGYKVLLRPQPYLLEEMYNRFTSTDKRISEIQQLRKFEQETIYTIRDWFFWKYPCWLMGIYSNAYQSDVFRYSGQESLDDQGSITSRHTLHPDNDRAVNALESDLINLGLSVTRHSFTYSGQVYHNVIADLPGCGYPYFDPSLLDWLRMMERRELWPWLHKEEPPPMDPPWKLKRPLDDKQIGHFEKEFLEHVDLEIWKGIDLEKLRLLRWWPHITKLYGYGAEVVVLGCHLDSSASRSYPYDPLVNPAPGADDDASGIASVLAAARYLTSLPYRLTHTVRFVFFNAEEQGMVGSQAYVAERRALNESIRGAFLVDMIGYNSDFQYIFEGHIGATNADVTNASQVLADLMQNSKTRVGGLGTFQVYRGNSLPPPGMESNREDYDPALGRSDHASFHANGYPAIVISEDFFANMPEEPPYDGNPNYHKFEDLAIDASYASKIACAVTLAVKELAE